MVDSAAQPTPEQSLVYLNLAQGIRMKYPNTWQKQEEAGEAGFLVAFMSPLEGPFDMFAENVNLIIQTLPAEITLEQCVRANYDQLLQIGQMTFVEQPVKDQLGTLPAYHVVYTGQQPDGPACQYLQYFAVHGLRVFTFTYTAEVAKYDKFLPQAKAIAASLEVK